LLQDNLNENRAKPKKILLPGGEIGRGTYRSSSAMDMLKGVPGASQVITYLHQQKNLPHDQEYAQESGVVWGDLKNTRPDTWILLKFPDGAGAIKYIRSSKMYDCIASKGGEIRTLQTTRSDKTFPFYKEVIGGNLLRPTQKVPVQFFVGRDSQVVRTRQKTRAVLKPSNYVTIDDMLAKFKPIWIKCAVKAAADLKGMVGIMIKNEAYEKARVKIDHLNQLNNLILDYEGSNNNDTPVLIRKALKHALLLAAAHYYPDEMEGNLDLGHTQPQLPEGVHHILRDIASGDSSKIRIILGFFKQTLISTR
jgi:hypothetical protein